MRYAEPFCATLYLDIEVMNVAFTGRKGRIFTSAGSGRRIDLMIEIVRQDFGAGGCQPRWRRAPCHAGASWRRTSAVSRERPRGPRPGTGVGPGYGWPSPLDLRRDWTIAVHGALLPG